MRNSSFLRNLGLIGALALVAVAANGLLNDRVPAPWIFATAVFGTLVLAAAITAATHRSKTRR